MSNLRVLWASVLIIIVDQVTKFWVRSTMYLGESIPVLGRWLRLTFTENQGMAFGLRFGSPQLVTSLAVCATILIIVYLWQIRRTPYWYRLSVAVVLGGAIGNIIDRIFYGQLFSYGDLFHGRVVDFIHVDMWRGVVSEAVPILGGEMVALFPIWNVADMAIVVGVVSMLVLQYVYAAEIEDDRIEQDREYDRESVSTVHGSVDDAASTAPSSVSSSTASDTPDDGPPRSSQH